ncbi:pentalenene synthase [Kitasatospora sp. NPDC001261]|uniref:terpene synthase family protein n=1 Tax=Kitasatospora sp. NPDC001261 TaxID=3364012 RepID=UPI0036A894E6
MSPHVDRAREHTSAWMYHFGLAEDRQANDRQLRDWKISELAGLCYPDATAEGLDLASDLMGWYFAPFDDLFDGELGRDTARSAQLLGEMTAILDRPVPVVGPGQPPVVHAFADLFRRSITGMSPAWRARAAHHWKGYLAGQYAEVVDRCRALAPDAQSCLHRRVSTTSTLVVDDLLERVNGDEVDDLVAHMPYVSQLRRIGAEIVAINNDVVSADREKARGDLANNLLLVLETAEGLTRGAALHRLAGMLRDRYERFERLERHAADPGRAPSPVPGALRNVAGLRDIVAGTFLWDNTTGRGST